MLGLMPFCIDSKRGKRRAAILDAARSPFVEKGFETTTLNVELSAAQRACHLDRVLPILVKAFEPSRRRKPNL